MYLLCEHFYCILNDLLLFACNCQRRTHQEGYTSEAYTSEGVHPTNYLCLLVPAPLLHQFSAVWGKICRKLLYGTAPSKGVILDEFSEHKSPISTSLVQI